MITESIFIQQKINNVFTAFADLSNWQRVLNDVLNVQTLYNDGYHQEFLMTINRPFGAETIRGICFCYPNSRIEMFMPEPLSGFKRIADIWTFEEWEEGTRVTVERRFELAILASANVEPDFVATTYEQAGFHLRSNLSKDLGLFKISLEAAHEKSLHEESRRN